MLVPDRKHFGGAWRGLPEGARAALGALLCRAAGHAGPEERAGPAERSESRQSAAGCQLSQPVQA